ncbi:hypothetical protein BS50DRAFT_405116 [Corynespora cassiicola Philippines]|uniref:Uncharacterized protein n=1 Tax=Corynespora cassiicola Philippines TaxID=1448308 RepID=A0A2T2NKV6_CORCC|nr:hypothetical protein BS50DRAFT_405116 [Corynespora cassiicola Philippines]
MTDGWPRPSSTSRPLPTSMRVAKALALGNASNFLQQVSARQNAASSPWPDSSPHRIPIRRTVGLSNCVPGNARRLANPHVEAPDCSTRAALNIYYSMASSSSRRPGPHVALPPPRSGMAVVVPAPPRRAAMACCDVEMMPDRDFRTKSGDGSLSQGHMHIRFPNSADHTAPTGTPARFGNKQTASACPLPQSSSDQRRLQSRPSVDPRRPAFAFPFDADWPANPLRCSVGPSRVSAPVMPFRRFRFDSHHPVMAASRHRQRLTTDPQNILDLFTAVCPRHCLVESGSHFPR